MGWLEGIRKVGARGEMGEASEGQDLLIKVWVGNDFQKKRKERRKIKKGSGEMEEEDVEEKS